MAERYRNPTPVWLRWLVIAFIGYAAFTHFMGRKETASGEPRPVTDAPAQASTLPAPVSGVAITGDIAGSGDEASCGQEATGTVQAIRPDGTAWPEASGDFALKVGLPDPARKWAPGLSGMKSGGVREVTMTAREILGQEPAKEQGIDPDQGRFRFKIELKQLSPTLAPGTLPLRASDVAIGQGSLLACGDKAKIHLTLWKPDGTIAYTTRGKEPVELTVGAGEHFYGLDRGVMNLRLGSQRALIIPPGYLTGPPDDAILAGIPRDRTLLADVELLEIRAVPLAKRSE